tara:strand:+ start:725 stop:1174 length:450 start_codon:yes stop_codon:yes gene_type:complete
MHVKIIDFASCQIDSAEILVSNKKGMVWFLNFEPLLRQGDGPYVVAVGVMGIICVLAAVGGLSLWFDKRRKKLLKRKEKEHTDQLRSGLLDENDDHDDIYGHSGDGKSVELGMSENAKAEVDDLFDDDDEDDDMDGANLAPVDDEEFAF